MNPLLRRYLGALFAVHVATHAQASTEAQIILASQGGGETTLTDRLTILGFSKGTENTVNIGSLSGGAGAGKATPKTARMSFTPNAATTEMFRGLTTGEPYRMKFLLVGPPDSKGDKPPLTEISFDLVMFSDLTVHAASGDDLVEVEVEFEYGSIYWTEHHSTGHPGTPNGPTSAGWAFTLNSTVIRDFFDTPTDGGGGPGDDDPGDDDPGGGGPTDTDGDGLPDSWEDAHGLDKNLRADGSQNADGDALSNLEEFIAGTDPNSASSFFRTEISVDDGTLRLEWDSIPRRRYRILHSATLSDRFIELDEITTSNGATTQYRPAPGTGPFYRIEALLEP